jgi:hypothetical protein
MKKAVWSGLVAVGMLALATPVFAQQTDTKSLTVNASVLAKAKLDLNAASISFPDQDPDAVAVIPAAAALLIDVKARTSANGSVTLTVQAGGPLTSGTNTIAISALKWTVAGAGMVAGTASTTAVSVGSWTGSGNRNNLTQNYTLDNSWAYNTGTYSATLTYTLTAP